jgi:hypothetical protein
MTVGMMTGMRRMIDMDVFTRIDMAIGTTHTKIVRNEKAGTMAETNADVSLVVTTITSRRKIQRGLRT